MKVEIEIADEDWEKLRKVDVFRIIQNGIRMIEREADTETEDILLAISQLRDVGAPLSRIQHAIRNGTRKR